MQVVLLLETRPSCDSDYRYIKSTIDYFYPDRSFKLSKIYAKTKPELLSLDKKIEQFKKKYVGKTIVVMCADYDRNDDPINEELIKYCKRHNYELVWMNLDVEEVFLGRRVSANKKKQESLRFLKNKNNIIPNLSNISVLNPIEQHPSSNLLVVLDRYLTRKT